MQNGNANGSVAVRVRRAERSDAEAVFLWRNDEATRLASVSQKIVDPEEHEAWFASSLRDDHRFLYIAERDGLRVGMCRFDFEHAAGSAEVSINLNPEFRGQGLSGPVLDSAIAHFRAESGPGTVLTATIRPANLASIHIFERAGFVRESEDDEFAYYVG